MQREQQHKLMDEMFSPITQQILPASIEERLELYTQRNRLEDEAKKYKIIKEKFLNYRQFTCKLIQGKTQVIPSYALCYSTLPRKRTQGKIEFTCKDVFYFNRDEIKFITLAHFNTLANTYYNSVKELLFAPPPFEKELSIRNIITQNPYDLSPLIVIENSITSKLTLHLDAKVYEDTKEKLIII